MNLKVFILFIFLSFFINLKTNAARTVLFQLDTSLRMNKDIPFRYFKVIDKRKDKNLGVVKFSIYKPVAKIIAPISLANSITEFTNKLILNTNKGDDTLLFVLHDYNFSTNPPLANCYLNGQFFIGKNNQYQFVKNVDSFYFWTNNNLEETIFRTASFHFYSLINQVILLSKEKNVSEILSSQDATNYLEIVKRQIPIYNANNFKKGIFKTVDDFLNNKPLDTPFIQSNLLKDFKKVPEFYYVDDRGKKKAYVRNIFAVFNGEKWYMPQQSGWVPIQFENNDFYTMGYFDCIHNTQTAPIIYTSGIMFGFLGAMVATMATYNVHDACLYNARFDPIAKKFLPVKAL